MLRAPPANSEMVTPKHHCVVLLSVPPSPKRYIRSAVSVSLPAVWFWGSGSAESLAAIASHKVRFPHARPSRPGQAR